MVGTLKSRIIFYLDPLILKRLDKFQHRHGFASRSRTIAWLIAWALSQNPTPPPQRDDDEYYE